MENIWITIISSLRDVAVAIIDLFKKDKDNPKSFTEETIKYEESKIGVPNPFLPSDSDIDNGSIKNPKYFSNIGAYLASDRSPRDIVVTEREDKG